MSDTWGLANIFLDLCRANEKFFFMFVALFMSPVHKIDLRKLFEIDRFS